MMDGAMAQDRAAARLACGMASYVFGVPMEAICAKSRGAPEAAFARQAAMYLTHVAFSMSLNRVAIAFGRDRSTVAHACHLIEDRRDDPEMDSLFAAMEEALQSAPLARAGRRAALR